MSTSILYRAPAGIAGAITRADLSAVEPGFLAAAGFPTKFGQPVKISAGKFVLMGLASVAADFYGIVTRFTPAISNTTAEGLADGGPWPEQFVGILTRGYVNVECVIGTPARGGIVYVRIVDGGVGKPVGQYEATADGVNSVALTNVIWSVDGKDASNITEIRVGR
jgi:hypothetical protein